MTCTMGDRRFRHCLGSQSKVDPVLITWIPRVKRSPQGSHLVHRLYGMPGKGFGTRILFTIQRKETIPKGKNQKAGIVTNILMKGKSDSDVLFSYIETKKKGKMGAGCKVSVKWSVKSRRCWLFKVATLWW